MSTSNTFAGLQDASERVKIGKVVCVAQGNHTGGGWKSSWLIWIRCSPRM